MENGNVTRLTAAQREQIAEMLRLDALDGDENIGNLWQLCSKLAPLLARRCEALEEALWLMLPMARGYINESGNHDQLPKVIDAIKLLEDDNV